jgi:hypothetical protein
MTKADCREVFEMDTTLTAWLRVYGRIQVEVKPGYRAPRYWSKTETNICILRPVVLGVMQVHRKFFKNEFLPAVARWREIAPGEPVPTDKEV